MPRDTIKSLAAEIKRRWPNLDVRVERGHCNTDRKAGRLCIPGKGRWGTRIIVVDPSAPFPSRELHPLLDHNNADTYRRTSEVREWMERYAETHPK